MDRAWLSRHPAEVAFDLIGCHLGVERDDILTSGRIVEVEAYAGVADDASHSVKLSVAKDVMARAAGTIYVYRSYGIHTCMNLVAHAPGHHGGILIRAVEPVVGIEIMRERRGDVPDRQLGRGPGNVGQALGVVLTDIGDDLFEGSVFTLGVGKRPAQVWASPRIGISKSVDHLWRFFDPASNAVSVHRRGVAVTPADIQAHLQGLPDSVE